MPGIESTKPNNNDTTMTTIQQTTLYCPQCKCDRPIRESLTTRTGKLVILTCSHMIEEMPVKSELEQQLEQSIARVEREKQRLEQAKQEPDPFDDYEDNKKQHAKTIAELTRNLKEFT